MVLLFDLMDKKTLKKVKQVVGHKLFIKGWDYRDFYGSIAVKYGCSSEKEPPLPTGPGGHCFF